MFIFQYLFSNVPISYIFLLLPVPYVILRNFSDEESFLTFGSSVLSEFSLRENRPSGVRLSCLFSAFRSYILTCGSVLKTFGFSLINLSAHKPSHYVLSFIFSAAVSYLFKPFLKPFPVIAYFFCYLFYLIPFFLFK